VNGQQAVSRLAMGQIEQRLRMLHGFGRLSVVDRGCFVHRLHPF
jgi:hypothetical protein